MLRAWQRSVDFFTMVWSTVPGGAARSHVEQVAGKSFELSTSAPRCGSGALVWQSARTLTKYMEQQQPALRGGNRARTWRWHRIPVSGADSPAGACYDWCSGQVACCLGAEKAVATEQGLFELPGHLNRKHKVLLGNTKQKLLSATEM